MKFCNLCKETKEYSYFSKNKYVKSGLSSNCKDCQKKYRENNKLKNKENILNIQNLQCTKCLQILDISFFSRKTNSPRGFNYWCKPCRLSYSEKHRKNNIERIRFLNNLKRKKRIEWFHNLKSGKPCKDCNETYEPYCMDYDHLYGKVKSISYMVLKNSPKEQILKEIDKCELVCCLCHNLRTKKRLDIKYPNKTYSIYVQRNIEIINKAKSMPCYICNIQRELCNMEFDHIDQNKKYKNISSLKGFKVKILKKEIKKCRIICTLCHRRKSILEQKNNLKNKKIIKRKEIVIRKRKNKAKDGELWCNKCSISKSYDYFSKRKNSKTGYEHYCKDCLNLYRQKYRKNKKN